MSLFEWLILLKVEPGILKVACLIAIGSFWKKEIMSHCEG